MTAGSDCIEYPRARSDGYGRVRFHGKSWVASRLAYFWSTGTDPGDSVVMHMCDNPPCVNPEHLVLGAHDDNVKDKIRKGRHVFGSLCGQAKLTEETAREALRLLRDGMFHREVALVLGVSKSNIGCLHRGETWGHLARG